MSLTVLPSGCGVCGRQKDLLRCAGCKVMRYCGREHQAENWNLHKSACNAIRRCRVSMEKEEQILINHPGHILMQAAPFVNSVGHFWGILETRDYMRARYTLADTMEMIHTVESTEGQLEHYMDMLRLCRSDNLGVRDIVPGLMLCLDKDQECYDFIKWWTLVGKDSEYDWDDMDLPYLDIKKADVFEPVDYFDQKFLDLSHSVCLIILKIKLLLDLMKLQQSTFSLGTKVPREILDMIQTSVPQSPILRENFQLMNEEGQERAARVEQLKGQIDALFEMINNYNAHFWPAVADPERHLLARPETYSMGSVQEMEISLRFTYDAIAQTPGTLDFMKAKIQQKI